MDLREKVVVVTGASMGIGEALARAFLRGDCKVVLSARDPGRLETARARLGAPDRSLAITCDVRNREEIDRLLSLSLHNFGRLDIWINNAGFGIQDSVAAMDMKACRNLFDTNLFGAIECMQAVIPVMKRQRSGMIINVSSVAGHIPLPYWAAYSASKFGINAIGKAARLELLGSGVHVMTVCPGTIATNFRQNAVKGQERPSVRWRERRGISAERVAAAVVNACRTEKREVIVPWQHHISVKFYQLFPGLVEWAMSRGLGAAEATRAEAAPGPYR
ncbi:MAG TPA: SDR family NAD(P)-dependent oxidoreductase [Terriglobales bacterium]|nr:SDR family NAD(P)-dependent oxidoreductase [Terriglobales bacterium]